MERQGQDQARWKKANTQGYEGKEEKRSSQRDRYIGVGEVRANNKDRQDRGRQKQRASEEKEAGRGKSGGEARSRPGQAWGQGPGQGCWWPGPSAPSVCPQALSHRLQDGRPPLCLLPTWLLKYVRGRRAVEKTAPGINNPAQPPETRTLRTPG